MNKCPYCNRDPLDAEPKLKARELCKKNGLKGEYMNPGGRELIFPFGSIQLTDCCSWCDYETLKEEIEKMNK